MYMWTFKPITWQKFKNLPLVNSEGPSRVNLEFIWVKELSRIIFNKKYHSAKEMTILSFTGEVYTDTVPTTHLRTITVILIIASKYYYSILGIVQ